MLSCRKTMNGTGLKKMIKPYEPKKIGLYVILITAIMALDMALFPWPCQAASFSVEKAFICEEIIDREPVNIGVVFKNGIEKIHCLTVLDKVSENETIYHNWYKKDRLSSRIKLSVKPPKWSTYSSIQLRDYDNGPWRVDITNADGHVLKTLRFSILD